ncbi:MAG: NAD(P)-binding protein [Pseudomonadota bacterium]
MGLLKKTDKKPFKIVSRGGAGGGVSSARPNQVEKLAPCMGKCPSGNDVRGFITVVSQAKKTGLSDDQALQKAWELYVETNPFPSSMGRICPHPCESECNRTHKDSAVGINAIERFIGDFGMNQGLKLKKLDETRQSESIGVIGAGPAGLSFAYQLARRGYPVTVYEKTPKAGGMLYWGIPFYRLPADVLQKEVDRIVDLGVELKLNCRVGTDISVDELKKKHQFLFLGIGADKGKLMRVPGEDGPGVWTGTGYLYRVNAGEKVDVGKSVAIIGGGDTAIDAARMARRTGADVTILYRRTRVEMPAIDSEVEDALKEGIKLELLIAPIAVHRSGDKLEAIEVQKMELGEPDSSGRRRPVPIEGSNYKIPIDTLIAAISQEPDFDGISELGPTERWLKVDGDMKVEGRDKLWTGGDALDLGIATTAVGHGRQAALAVHHMLRHIEKPVDRRPPIPIERIKLDFYEPKAAVEKTHRPVDEWLSKPDDEIMMTLSSEQFMAEVDRCFSCGQCFNCERCWMYCTPSCFKKIDATEVEPGHYYKVNLDTCDGCKKCAEECPCGFLDMA